MRFTTIKLRAILMCLSTSLAVKIVAQKPDCQPPKPTIDGRWKDDLNGQEVIIATVPGKMVATYATPDKKCRNPDHDGKPVPFQTDFEGNYTNGSTVEGFIF